MFGHTTLIATFSAFLAATTALPSTQRSTGTASDFSRFSLKAKATRGTFDFNGQGLNFWLGGLYIGRQTTTSCPSDITACDIYPNITAIGVSNTNSRASADVAVPGGQIVYVNSTGEVRYTTPHAQNVPTDAYQTGWIHTEVFPNPGTPYSKITFKGRDWVACQSGGEDWTVQSAFIGFGSECIEIELLSDTDLTGKPISAYEYKTAKSA